MQSCEKQSPFPAISKPRVVAVNTSGISDITPTSAISGGFVATSDEYEVIERGITWGTAENPTIDLRKTSDGTGAGPFTSIITGLTENTVYFVRAYAAGGEGITYGRQLSFRTPSPAEPDFPGEIRFDATSFFIGNKRYFGLGHYPPMRDYWEYDQISGTWTRKADYPGNGLTSAVGFSVGTKGYVGTGYIQTSENISNSNEFWEYDPETDTWTEKESLPSTGRGHAVGFSIGSKGYIGAGNHSDGIGGFRLSDFWEWDQSTNLWTRKSDYPGSVLPSVGFSIGTKGYFGNSGFGEFWEWDQSANLWKSIAAFP